MWFERGRTWTTGEGPIHPSRMSRVANRAPRPRRLGRCRGAAGRGVTPGGVTAVRCDKKRCVTGQQARRLGRPRALQVGCVTALLSHHLLRTRCAPACHKHFVLRGDAGRILEFGGGRHPARGRQRADRPTHSLHGMWHRPAVAPKRLPPGRRGRCASSAVWRRGATGRNPGGREPQAFGRRTRLQAQHVAAVSPGIELGRARSGGCPLPPPTVHLAHLAARFLRSRLLAAGQGCSLRETQVDDAGERRRRGRDGRDAHAGLRRPTGGPFLLHLATSHRHFSSTHAEVPAER